MLQNFLNPVKQATASLSEPQAGIRGSQSRLTAWLCLGISKPSITSSHLRLLYNSGGVAPGKTLVGDDLGLHHPGNPRASAPTQWTSTDPIGAPPPCPFMVDPPRRVEVGGQGSQPILAADWPG